MDGRQHPELTAKAKARFLDVYRRLGIITTAAEYAGVDRSMIYVWAEHDNDFKAALDDARQQAADRLEEIAMQRASGYERTEVESEPEMEWVRDEAAGKAVQKPTGRMRIARTRVITEVSDSMIQFMLKAMRPDKYRERLDVARTDVPPVKLVDAGLYENV